MWNRTSPRYKSAYSGPITPVGLSKGRTPGRFVIVISYKLSSLDGFLVRLNLQCRSLEALS